MQSRRGDEWALGWSRESGAGAPVLHLDQGCLRRVVASSRAAIRQRKEPIAATFAPDFSPPGSRRAQGGTETNHPAKMQLHPIEFRG
jgi:hypothetical protein